MRSRACYIVGAFLGGLVFNFMGIGGSSINNSDFSLGALLVSFVGAVILLPSPTSFAAAVFASLVRHLDQKWHVGRARIRWCSVIGAACSGGATMAHMQRFSVEEARRVGAALGVNWQQIDLEQFRRGMEVELEHGARDPETNVTDDDLSLTGKIAWAHLKEYPDYYTRLDALEAEADAYWKTRR